MIEEIKRRLEAGGVVELECVDRGGFLKDTDRREANEKIIDQGPLVVDYIDSDGDIRLVGNIGDIYCNVIVGDEFKYFRIKEPTATFNDLIDVAMKAWKDGYLKVLEFERGVVEEIFTVIGEDAIRWLEGDSDYRYAVDLINSLYTETFVIESEEDIKRIEKDASVVLSNEMEVISSSDAFKIYNGWSVRFGENKQGTLMNFSFLKGATVTQKRDK